MSTNSTCDLILLCIGEYNTAIYRNNKQYENNFFKYSSLHSIMHMLFYCKRKYTRDVI